MELKKRKQGEHVKKENKILFVVGMVLIAGVVLILPTKRVVYKDLTAIKYELNNSSYEEKIEIVLKGSIKNKGLKFNEYKGIVSIDDLELHFNTKDKRYAVLSYIGEDEATKSYGTMYIEGELEKITIMPSGWSLEDGVMTSAPALSREEALIVGNETMKMFLDYHNIGEMK